MKVKNRLIKPEQPLNLQNLPRFDHELDEGEDLQEDSCLGYVKKSSSKGSWYSCRDCALDFICKSCVKKCHTTHEFSLMSVKVAQCYCATTGMCCNINDAHRSADEIEKMHVTNIQAETTAFLNTHVKQHSIGQDLVRLLRKTTVLGEDDEFALDSTKESFSFSKSAESKSPDPSCSVGSSDDLLRGINNKDDDHSPRSSSSTIRSNIFKSSKLSATQSSSLPLMSEKMSPIKPRPQANVIQATTSNKTLISRKPTNPFRSRKARSISIGDSEALSSASFADTHGSHTTSISSTGSSPYLHSSPRTESQDSAPSQHLSGPGILKCTQSDGILMNYVGKPSSTPRKLLNASNSTSSIAQTDSTSSLAQTEVTTTEETFESKDVESSGSTSLDSDDEAIIKNHNLVISSSSRRKSDPNAKKDIATRATLTSSTTSMPLEPRSSMSFASTFVRCPVSSSGLSPSSSSVAKTPSLVISSSKARSSSPLLSSSPRSSSPSYSPESPRNIDSSPPPMSSIITASGSSLSSSALRDSSSISLSPKKKRPSGSCHGKTPPSLQINLALSAGSQEITCTTPHVICSTPDENAMTIDSMSRHLQNLFAKLGLDFKPHAETWDRIFTSESVKVIDAQDLMNTFLETLGDDHPVISLLKASSSQGLIAPSWMFLKKLVPNLSFIDKSQTWLISVKFAPRQIFIVHRKTQTNLARTFEFTWHYSLVFRRPEIKLERVNFYITGIKILSPVDSTIYSELLKLVPWFSTYLIQSPTMLFRIKEKLPTPRTPITTASLQSTADMMRLGTMECIAMLSKIVKSADQQTKLKATFDSKFELLKFSTLQLGAIDVLSLTDLSKLSKSVIEIKRAQNIIVLIIGRLETEVVAILQKYHSKKKSLQVSSKRSSHWLDCLERLKPIITVYTQHLDVFSNLSLDSVYC